jgi:hypothetical protein
VTVDAIQKPVIGTGDGIINNDGYRLGEGGHCAYLAGLWQHPEDNEK